MRIGVVGARVAGSYAGLLLARLGHEVILLDDSTEREKPCGGGVTGKAIRRMGWLKERPLPHTQIAAVRLMMRNGYASELPLSHAIHVFSRHSLDLNLRRWAMDNGARFMPERVLDLKRDGRGWSIKTSSGEIGADYLVGADGVNSIVRARISGQFQSGDLSLSLGFSLAGLFDSGTLLIQFQESGFHGYLWSFPRVDHSSVGILQWLPGAHSADLRKRVESFIDMHYPEVGSDKQFYAAKIPCLSRKSLAGQRVCGENWALLGDAAGFTDAITAEGIYYALRSAELMVESIRGGNPAGYERAWRHDFGTELQSAAVWRDRFYAGMVLSHTFIRRMLQTVHYSDTVCGLLDNLIAGNISYGSLLRNIALRSPAIIVKAFRTRALTSKTPSVNR